VTILTDARVVQGDQVVEGGWVRWEGERLAEVGRGPLPVDRHRSAGGRLVVPGFVDIHVHGGGGGSFTTGSAEDGAAVARFHRRRGTTTLLASLVTAPRAELLRQISALAELVDDGIVAGLHLEGPFLSSARCGAHPPRLLRAPTPAALDRLLCRRPGAVRMATLAPELDGGIDAIAQLAAAGVVPAIGHSDAAYDVAHAAVDAGARVATHLFNAMRPIHHREPGVVVALMERPEVVCELTNDGLHLHPSLVRWVLGTVGESRAALVSDAIAAAGADDGLYALGGSTVRVRDGRAELVDGSSLAGSTLTMDAAFRRVVQCQGRSVGAAARAAATTPAAVLGLDDVGRIAPGRLANLVVLEEDLTARAVLYRGSWVDGRTP
jgi:N-acetylglucosamine-6-phosphate deacetylase